MSGKTIDLFCSRLYKATGIGGATTHGFAGLTQANAGGNVLVDATEVPGGVQTTIEIRVEVEGCHDPACVVESLSRWMR